MGKHPHPRGSGDNSNLIELTREEWKREDAGKCFD